MARKLVIHPAAVLRKRAAPVGRFDASLRELVEDMFRIMEEHEGIGLAAPQVGESVRLFVTAARGPAPRRVYANPEILRHDGELVGDEEGCLSLPDIRGVVRRPERCALRAFDLDGREFTEEAGGLMARCWQHEIDHLDGILIINRMTPLDRLANRRKVKQLEAEAAG